MRILLRDQPWEVVADLTIRTLGAVLLYRRSPRFRRAMQALRG